MSGRITNLVLAEKIDNIQKTLDDDIKPAVKENTAFRQKFIGIMTTISLVSAVIGATIIKLVDKIWK